MGSEDLIMQGVQPNAALGSSIYTLAHSCLAIDDDARPAVLNPGCPRLKWECSRSIRRPSLYRNQSRVTTLYVK